MKQQAISTQNFTLATLDSVCRHDLMDAKQPKQFVCIYVAKIFDDGP